ncbi:Uncharacterized membrane-anchored protein conserved in bacteria [Serratia entomophila]|uniref:Membrane-anchored protein n=1 Tax=Serratia entomophila TaxID=42906 RepID=A0ABY5CL21_9GAMM|nr:hypothetical protein [Serratia entomophila]UIW16275.1 hypothetical protein KHA73_12530 [Serratia entomophila]USU98833.1 hypothetical protein KFQ06_12175 [Serratia entomophila]CAI0706004.1 Uncharacterized membrane-anchored protein conserved in bacteria [Serratia entomophila]CAI0807006.1 Uncharacterized membrane-anchored protein conserved in bacteria [Serratia entomophila]CAI0817591.1 Uncharacterized membrane-anchored protein conserved in bacteria [Serratia entomophila]
MLSPKAKNALHRLNKVPEVTLFFWLIKMMSTTVGETAADYLNMDLNFGLTKTSLITGGLLLAALFFQIRARRYLPPLYWIAVVLISVFGTLITDNLTDHFGVSLAFSTGLFSLLLAATFVIWHRSERTLSIHAIDTPKRELFYWLAILFTFALGTAAGDWVAEGWRLGYVNSAWLFGALIAVTAAAHYLFKANSILCFWIAYVLTRPFGASCGDLLSQPVDNGGLGLGAASTSGLFLVVIISLVTYLTLMQRRRRGFS